MQFESALSHRWLGIEREIEGQCDYGVKVFESIQIKPILNCSLKPF